MSTRAHSHPSDSRRDTALGSLASGKGSLLVSPLLCCCHISLPPVHSKDKRTVVPLETVRSLPERIGTTTRTGQGTALPLKQAHAHTIYRSGRFVGPTRGALQWGEGYNGRRSGGWNRRPGGIGYNGAGRESVQLQEIATRYTSNRAASMVRYKVQSGASFMTNSTEASE